MHGRQHQKFGHQCTIRNKGCASCARLSLSWRSAGERGVSNVRCTELNTLSRWASSRNRTGAAGSRGGDGRRSQRVLIVMVHGSHDQYMRTMGLVQYNRSSIIFQFFALLLAFLLVYALCDRKQNKVLQLLCLGPLAAYK